MDKTTNPPRFVIQFMIFVLVILVALLIDDYMKDRGALDTEAIRHRIEAITLPHDGDQTIIVPQARWVTIRNLNTIDAGVTYLGATR